MTLDRLVFDKKENQPSTCPLEHNILGDSNPTTPTKKKENTESEQMIDDSESENENDEPKSDDSDDNEDDSENEAEKEAKVQEMKEFAEANGITLEFEKKKEETPNYDAEPFVMTKVSWDL